MSMASGKANPSTEHRIEAHTGSASLGQPPSTGHLDALALRDRRPDGKADSQRQLAHCVVSKQAGQLAKSIHTESRQNSSTNGREGERERGIGRQRKTEN